MGAKQQTQNKEGANMIIPLRKEQIHREILLCRKTSFFSLEQQHKSPQ
ncbi:hypothetical protein PORCRE_965 [Porphyromonas crevioricanis JCM 15906]|uniref:Uncharacterized protein n=1 Tax=Porphyromonas crevioricanis JCM 15906 TaxID=1305617 RepID=T1DRI2_9PORP|nr:hypothetical protein PORCRE_965 [Porphyromonas crevioricanis JCM 15906]GAD06659.1 hypothetical protein PORCAN_257 [Porphyromonas crevioricanis JCM 13913]